MRKYIFSLLLLCLCLSARGQTTAILDSLGLPHPVAAGQLRYWFDSDNGNMVSVSCTNGTHTIDVSQLDDGLHTLHYQVQGTDGGVYSIASGIFLRMKPFVKNEETVTATKLMYWFDDEENVQLIDLGGVQMLDASALVDGLHTLHYQVLCSNGTMTPASSVLFLRMNFPRSAW